MIVDTVFSTVEHLLIKIAAFSESPTIEYSSLVAPFRKTGSPMVCICIELPFFRKSSSGILVEQPNSMIRLVLAITLYGE